MQVLSNPDFGQVAMTALPLAAAIAARLAPPPFDGKRVGARYLWRNRTRVDRHLGSASLHLPSGLWADFALPDDPHARGQGLTSWVGYLYQIPSETAERWLGGMLGLCAVDPAAPTEFRPLTGEEETFAGQVAVHLETEAPAWLAADIPARRDGLDALYVTLRQTHGEPAHVYAWRRADGRTALLTLRFQSAQGKAVRPVIWARPAEDPAAPLRWVPAWPASIPLFNADRLALKPTAPVLVCEGEKATLAAAALLPDYVCTCVGGNLHQRADWSLLVGRDVTIWPDHDAAGLRYAETVRQRAVAAGAAVSVVNVPDHYPLKWDLADPLPPGVSVEHLRGLIHAARGPAGARGPDLSILDLNRRAVPAPADVLPSWSRWLTTAARAKSAPVDYLLAALLGVASGLLAGRLQVEVRPGWVEPAILWVLLVGDSAAGKSPALEAVEVGIEALEQRLRQRYSEERLLYETATEPDPADKPFLHRVRLEDTTVEAAAAVLAREGRGLIGWSPEMTSWVTALTRYRQGGGNDRGFWLKCYDARPYSVDRRKLGDEPLLIPAMAIALCGAIQPDLLPPLLLNELDDGLAARFLTVWPSPAPAAETVDAAAWSWAEQQIAQAAERLYAAGAEQIEEHPVTGRQALTLHLSENAQARFLAWREDYLAALRRRYGDAIPSFEGKAMGHVVRLAAVLHALDWAITARPDLPPVIAEATLSAAIELRVGFFGGHRERCEMDAGEPSPERLARVLARYLVEANVETIDPAVLRRHVRLPGLRTEARLRLALLELQAAGWLAAGTAIPRQEKDPLPAVIAVRTGVLAAARQGLVTA
jgi:hypothetical protein